MDRSPVLSRRGFVRVGAAAAALSPLAGPASHAVAQAPEPGGRGGDPLRGLKLGIASYSFNRLPREAAIEAIRRVGVHYASIKDAHLSLKSSAEERKAAAKQFLDAGIKPMSCGNITMSDDESDIRNAFEYARDAGIPTIVCKPTRKSLPVLDRMVKEFDIKIAIHNHGPEDKVWPSPYDPWEAVQSFDERIGLCIDVGHTARCGVDPVQAIRKCSARLYDLHIKDLAAIEEKSRPVEVGRGVLDIPGILRALLDIRYPYLVGLEYEKNLKTEDPVIGAAESIGYIRGVLAMMKSK
jgi:inosose dehydratase